jgi:hypothetical protein
VDRDSAIRILHEQEIMLRQKIRSFLMKESKRADGIAETLTPLLDESMVQVRRDLLDCRENRWFLKPYAKEMVRTAYAWKFTYHAPWGKDPWSEAGAYDRHSYSKFVADPTDRRGDMAIAPSDSGGMLPPRDPRDTGEGFGTQRELDDTVRILYEEIRNRARKVREYEPPAWLTVPEDVHPPRHGRLRSQMLARLVAEDVAEHITAGRALESALAHGTPVTTGRRRWLLDVRLALYRSVSSEIVNGFVKAAGLEDYNRSDPLMRLLDDPMPIERAYLTLGITYLEEIQQRMPDYAEASQPFGSQPTVSMTFSGGTYVGGQFAGQIANIDSTIEHGSADVGQALHALEQAVLAQEGLDDEQRRDLLDSVEYLADAAQTPPEKRKRGVVRSALEALKVAAIAGGELSQVIDSWGTVLHKLLN